MPRSLAKAKVKEFISEPPMGAILHALDLSQGQGQGHGIYLPPILRGVNFIPGFTQLEITVCIL